LERALVNGAMLAPAHTVEILRVFAENFGTRWRR